MFAAQMLISQREFSREIVDLGRTTAHNEHSLAREGVPTPMLRTTYAHHLARILCACSISVLIAGSAGCQSGFNLGGFTPFTGGNPFGLLINTDINSNVLGVLRLATGESVFSYGAFQSNGLIQRVDGFVYRDAVGQEAKVELTNGLVSRATSFDGSTIEITYTEASTSRLTGTVRLSFASLIGDDAVQVIPFDVDLQMAASELAGELQDLLGINVASNTPPENPIGKVKLEDSRMKPTAKPDVAAQLILAFVAFHQAAFAAIGYVIVEVMAGVVSAVANLLVGVVAAVTQTVVVALFTPFILMGEILRVAVFQPAFTVDLNFDVDVTPPDFR